MTALQHHIPHSRDTGGPLPGGGQAMLGRAAVAGGRDRIGGGGRSAGHGAQVIAMRKAALLGWGQSAGVAIGRLAGTAIGGGCGSGGWVGGRGNAAGPSRPICPLE